MVVYVVKDGAGEDGVDRLGQAQLEQVLALHGNHALVPRLAGVLGQPKHRPRSGHHRRRGIDRHQPALRELIEQQPRHPPRAAAGVEHALVPAQAHAGDDLPRPGLLRVGHAVIRGRVPVQPRTHSAVVTGIAGLRPSRSCS